MNIFGWSIGKRKADDSVEEVLQSVVGPELDDGTMQASSAASYYGYYVDMDGTVKDELQAIQKYRELALYPEVDIAIQDIVNEAIPYEDEGELVEIILDKMEASDSIKDTITKEFKTILSLLKFSEKAPDLFRKWYVDGRLYFNVLTDKNQKNGIVELRQIEATKIKKVVEIIKEKTPEGVEIVKGMKEYFVYSQNGFITNTNIAQQQTSTAAQGIKMSTDSVVYIPSGFTDSNTGNVMSYLQKALRPANQLRMLEDAIVIYRLSRAPERRIFYVDVGNLPKGKAEQYVKDIMNRYRNKLVYDAKTGEVRDDKKYMSMMEDFWMPRRDGGKGTEITTLPGGQNLGELTDVEYFQHKLYNALNIPISRVLPDQGFSIGRSTEVTRDEVKFQKFISKVRRKFSELFYDLLRTQLILRGVIAEDEWEEIKEQINFRFQKDNFFSELKNTEILMNRVQTALAIEPLLGKYFSVENVAKNIFKFSNEEVEKMEEQMEQEYADHPWWYQTQQMYDQQQQMGMQQAFGTMPAGQGDQQQNQPQQ
jgi:hypothetical protein